MPNLHLFPGAEVGALAEGRTVAEEILYWNEQGEVACERHAPARISDAWRSEDWVRIDAHTRKFLREKFDRINGPDQALCHRCWIVARS